MPRQLGLLCAALILLSGCESEDPTLIETPEPPALRGRVLDAAGEPAPGVKINLIYGLAGWPGSAAPRPVAPPPQPVDTLRQNYPNPFNPVTVIPFSLADAQPISLMVLGAAGDTLRTLEHGYLPAGEHTREWDGRDEGGALLPNGLYRLRLTFHADVDGPSMEIGGVFPLSSDPEILAQSALAESDAGGGFAIPMSGLPVGEFIPVFDAVGEIQGVFSVLPEIQVHAALDAVTWIRVGLDLGDLDTDVVTELQLP